MDAARKRAASAAVQLSIGLVTSPRGDAVHDVLRTLRRRFPLARVLVAGVPVEGARRAARASWRACAACARAGCRGGAGRARRRVVRGPHALQRRGAGARHRSMPRPRGHRHRARARHVHRRHGGRPCAPPRPRLRRRWPSRPSRESLAQPALRAHARALHACAHRRRQWSGRPPSVRTLRRPPRVSATPNAAARRPDAQGARSRRRTACSAPCPSRTSPATAATSRPPARAGLMRASCPRAAARERARAFARRRPSACCALPLPASPRARPDAGSAPCAAAARVAAGPALCAPLRAGRRRVAAAHVCTTCRPCPSSGAATPSRAPRRAPWRSASRTRRLDRRSR